MIDVARHALPKFVTWVSGTYQTQKLTLLHNPVIVNSAAATGTITLPDISEAEDAGMVLTILCHTGTNATSIVDDDDSIDWTDITTLDAALDSVTLYPAARKWNVLLNDIA